MRICVIGAGGFIGRSLLRRLTGLPGAEITAFDRVPPVLEDASIRWIQGDLANSADCIGLVRDQDIIFHLAHINTPLTSDQDIVEDTALNLIPTLSLLKTIENIGQVPHVVYPSSGGAVYGVSQSRRRFREDDLCLPTNSYGIQKLMAEHYLRLAARHGTLTATVLRIANAYGWLLPPDRPQGFIGTALTRVQMGQPVRIFGSLNNVRDYVHIDDILDAFLLAAERRQGFDIYNIGSGVGVTVAGVIEIIEMVTGRPVARLTEGVRFAQYLNDWCVLDVEKAQRDLGWQSKIGLEDGIRKLLAL